MDTSGAWNEGAQAETGYDASPPIGRCRFSQLPARYQKAFESGANKIENGFFVAEKNPQSVLLAIPFYMLFSGVPLMLLYENREVVGDWYKVGWILPIVVLWFGVKATTALARHRRLCREDVIQYGLLVDDENLVMNQIAMLDLWCCVFVPRANIRRIYSQSEGGGSGGGYRGLALKIHFIDHGGSPRTLKLGSASSLERPPYVLDQLLADYLALDDRSDTVSAD
ncbi:MAG: hypothetical protein AAGC97_14690 [Planctomycetota bacterium]